jgi:hypothetical protein
MQADGIMDTGYQNTISGLLRKRGEMLASMADLREQIAVLSNDLESIERVMERSATKASCRPRRPASQRGAPAHRRALQDRGCHPWPVGRRAPRNASGK